MELSIHDNILYGYSVYSQPNKRPFYTIVFHTEYYHVTPNEYTDVFFHQVAAHHFEGELSNTILFDIRDADTHYIYDEYCDLFKRLQNHGWPSMYETRDDLLRQLAAEKIQAYIIDTSSGLQGWVWAKRVEIIARAERKVFSS
jgi:hypothetical protein